MLPIDLSGRVALVTGSSRGIGRAIARTLFAAGASVVLNGRTESRELAQVRDELAAERADGVALAVGDVADPASARAVVRSAFDRWKRLDILVNNAGLMRGGLIGMIPDGDVAATINVNLVGALATIQAAARLMARTRNGAVVNVASIIGLEGAPGQFAYAAAKAGLIGATRSAAKELAASGVRVNAVAPGLIETDLIGHLKPEERAERLAGIALRRVGTPEDVAHVVLFLVSDHAAYVTGQVIGVDGGMVI